MARPGLPGTPSRATPATLSAEDGQPAGLARRLGATVYEALVLTALVFAVGFALLPVVTPATPAELVAPSPGATPAPALYLPTPAARAWSGAALFAACAAYCIGLWSGGRRTLPMATWRLALRTAAGERVPPRQAAVRFLACGVGPALALAAWVALQPWGLGRWAVALLAANYVWALGDPDREFLQDRIAGTRLVLAAAPHG
jgi:hypothetical protein